MTGKLTARFPSDHRVSKLNPVFKQGFLWGTKQQLKQNDTVYKLKPLFVILQHNSSDAFAA